MITLHNTLTARKEPFEPIHPSEVRLYSCGPTVYSRPHIGNARSFVFADLLKMAERASSDRTVVTAARAGDNRHNT